MAKKKVFNIGNALSSGLEETITAARNYSGDLRVDVIPIHKVEVDPENPRMLLISFEDCYQGIAVTDPNRLKKIEEKEHLESMAASIKEQGIINPILVYKYQEKYRLIAGERRTLASILAGKSDIQAKILDSKPSELKISILQWIENSERSDLNLWERLKNLSKIITAHTTQNNMLPEQITITELSHLIGCTKSHAINYKAVLLAEDRIQHLIQENKIKNLEKAALIANVDSPIMKQQLIDACLNGASLKKLKILAQTPIKETKKTISKRGRQSTSIHFGGTKNISVARVIIDAVLNHKALSDVSSHFHEIDWENYQSITDVFKQLLMKLEELNA
jgi:ParB family chromosome partitioning protein